MIEQQLAAARIFNLFGSGLEACFLLEYRLENVVPLLLQLGDIELNIAGDDLVFGNSLANNADVITLALNLQNKRAVNGSKQLVIGEVVQLSSDVISETHFEHALGNAAVSDTPYRDSLLVRDKLFNGLEYRFYTLEIWQSVFIILRHNIADLAVRALELRGNNIIGLSRRYRERNKCRGNVDMLERSAHAVLAADCSAAHFKLCAVCSEQRRERLAPALSLALSTLKIFLERKPALLVGAARRNHLCYALDYRADRSMIRRLLGYLWIEAPAHYRGCFRISAEYGQFSRHCLNGGLLRSAAERHKHGSAADSAVKALNKSSLRAYVEVGN